MKIKNVRPCGYYIKVRVIDVEEKSKGGVIIATNKELQREKDAIDVGIVEEIGPTSYRGFAGCDSTDTTENANRWGIKVGDHVEFNRYDGKKTAAARYNPEFENIRTLNDQHIINFWEVE